MYSWWQYQLCDAFIEVIKPYIIGNDPKFAFEKCFAKDTLWFCLGNGLRLLHPFIPFFIEELWQRLPSTREYDRAKSIMICDYPSTIEVSFALQNIARISLHVIYCYPSAPTNEGL